VASLTGCSIDKGGIYTLTATDGSLTPATSGSLTISAGAAATVSVVSGSTQSATVAAAFSNPLVALVALVTDAYANPVSGATVTFTAPATGGSGTFTNASRITTAVTGSNGQATASVFTANTTAGPCSVTAIAGSGSATFALTNTAAAANKLAFGQQPSNTVAGVAISPAPTVRILDQFGNLTSSTASVTIAIGTNPSAGTLSGTKTVDAVNGVAPFSELSIDRAGNGYTLRATSSGLTSIESKVFNISGG